MSELYNPYACPHMCIQKQPDTGMTQPPARPVLRGAGRRPLPYGAAMSVSLRLGLRPPRTVPAGQPIHSTVASAG
jgi:hypothetical protein